MSEELCQLIPRNHVFGLSLPCFFLIAAIIEVAVRGIGDAANAAVQNTNDQVDAAKQAAADKVNEGANKLLKGAGLK